MRHFVLMLLVMVAGGVARETRADESVEDLWRQSYALEARGDHEGALRQVEGVVQRSGASYITALRSGWLLYLAARYAEAEAAYRKAISFEPAAIEPKMGIMLPLMAMRRWKEAERFGEEVLKAAPGESVVEGRMAWIAFNLGAYERAERLYRKVVLAYPGNIEMRTGLAWTLLKMNRLKEAKAEFDRVLSFAPDFQGAREGRALIP